MQTVVIAQAVPIRIFMLFIVIFLSS